LVCGAWLRLRHGIVRNGRELDGAASEDWPHRIGVATLPDGWFLVMFNQDLTQAFDRETIALSRHGPAVACAIEEHVMFQEARGYQDGAEVWRISHNPEKARSLYHLEIAGAPPASLKAFHETAIARQDEKGGEDAGVDFLSDVPLLVAKGLCGFKHDDEWPEGLAFTPVRRAKAAPATREGGFFSRLFGRR